METLPAPPVEESLSELFARDPEKLTLDDVGRIVAGLRRLRQNWTQEVVEAKSAGRKPKSAVAKVKTLSEPTDDGVL